MQSTLKIKNIVLIGQFEQANFDKYFFIKNSIAKEEEIDNTSSFDILLGTILFTKKYSIGVNNGNQIIITDLIPESNRDIISDIAIKIINAGNFTNFIALGINFHWFLEDESKSFENISKKYFYNEKSNLISNFFDSDNSTLGIYASTNFEDSRLKLEAKPVIATEIIDGELINCRGYNFIFNFHFDISKDEGKEKIIHHFNNYNKYEIQTQNIISLYK